MTNGKYVPKRRFKEFESDGEWEQKLLSELAEVEGGGTPSTVNPQYWDGDIDWYTPAEIGESVFVDQSKRKITVMGLDKSSAKILPIGTVLFTSRAGIGKTAILAREGCTNQGFQSIVPKEDLLASYFIYSQSNKLKQYGERIGSGSTFVEVSGKQMSEMPLIVPSIFEQKQIGNYFQTIDSLISLNQHKLDKLKDLKKAYLTEMFPAEGERMPKRRFPGFEGEWSTKELREITSLITKGTTPLDKSGEGEVNFIKVENLDASNGKILSCSKISSEEHNGYLKRSQLNENDILFSIAGTLGRIGIVESRILPANTNQALAIIRNERSNLRYLAIALKSGSVTNFILRNPTIGAQPNLSLEQVGSLEIPFPSLDEQKQIGEFFHKLDQSISLQQQKLDKLNDLKKAYMNELFV
ncbi:MAG: restriction endonuclease subunit S [Streptococcus salivarius]|jgi:hsdS subunit|uniref:restriction endonuclease subunit S n=1 Tax=Streptococcus salivarius TaxID=1304 RepID=UPI00093E3C61|nr:restriction endonuclease subunit S [Streptococcus salivarius]MBS4822851.1 restriction endonuclease subunit S [Streptococcus salivarius]